MLDLDSHGVVDFHYTHVGSAAHQKEKDHAWRQQFRNQYRHQNSHDRNRYHSQCHGSRSRWSHRFRRYRTFYRTFSKLMRKRPRSKNSSQKLSEARPGSQGSSGYVPLGSSGAAANRPSARPLARPPTRTPMVGVCVRSAGRRGSFWFTAGE